MYFFVWWCCVSGNTIMSTDVCVGTPNRRSCRWYPRAFTTHSWLPHRVRRLTSERPPVRVRTRHQAELLCLNFQVCGGGGVSIGILDFILIQATKTEHDTVAKPPTMDLCYIWLFEWRCLRARWMMCLLQSESVATDESRRAVQTVATNQTGRTDESVAGQPVSGNCACKEHKCQFVWSRIRRVYTHGNY